MDGPTRLRLDDQAVLWARLTLRSRCRPRGYVSRWHVVRFARLIDLEAAVERMAGIHERVILPPGVHPDRREEVTMEQLPPEVRVSQQEREAARDEHYRELGGES